MWYHWLLFVITGLLFAYALYKLFSPMPGTIIGWVWQLGLICIYGGIAYWSYSKATAPPPMMSFGGRRRY